MEEQEDGWLTVLEKNGLGPAAAIFDNYGIDSETDLLVFDQDDFRKLASRETYSGLHLEIIKVSLVAVKQAWI